MYDVRIVGLTHTQNNLIAAVKRSRAQHAAVYRPQRAARAPSGAIRSTCGRPTAATALAWPAVCDKAGRAWLEFGQRNYDMNCTEVCVCVFDNNTDCVSIDELSASAIRFQRTCSPITLVTTTWCTRVSHTPQAMCAPLIANVTSLNFTILWLTVHSCVQFQTVGFYSGTSAGENRISLCKCAQPQYATKNTKHIAFTPKKSELFS